MSDIQELENYLLDRLPIEDHLVMEARLLINPELAENALWQNRTYAIVNWYGRKKLKAEIEAVHNKLFSEKKYEGFRQKISSIFKRTL